MAIAITPLSDALGVEVTGADLSRPVDPADLDAMKRALADHLVMVVRGQKLTPAQYLDAVRLFGDTMQQHLTHMLMADHPEIAVLDSRETEAGSDGQLAPVGSRDWHTDHTNHARPPKITALYAVALVKAQARLRRAYAALEADGRPMQAAEVIPPPVSEAENAGPLFDGDAENCPRRGATNAR